MAKKKLNRPITVYDLVKKEGADGFHMLLNDIFMALSDMSMDSDLSEEEQEFVGIAQEIIMGTMEEVEELSERLLEDFVVC